MQGCELPFFFLYLLPMRMTIHSCHPSTLGRYRVIWCDMIRRAPVPVTDYPTLNISYPG